MLEVRVRNPVYASGLGASGFGDCTPNQLRREWAEVWVHADPVKSPLNQAIFRPVGQSTDRGIMLDQRVRLSSRRRNQRGPRSKEGLMTSGNSRVTVIEAPNQLPEFGRVSPIIDRVQNLFPDLGGVVSDSGVDFSRNLPDSLCRVRGRKLGAPHSALSHQLPNFRSE